MSSENSESEFENIEMDVLQLNKIVNHMVHTLKSHFLQKVFVYLTSKDIDNIWKSCNAEWKCLFFNDYFWKDHCKRFNFPEVEQSLRWPAYTNYITRFPYYWQGIFNYNRLLQLSWKNNIFKQNFYYKTKPCRMEYFDDEIYVVTETKDKRKTLNIYSSRTGKLIDGNLFAQIHASSPIVKRNQDLVYFWGPSYFRVWDMKNKTWQYCINSTEILAYNLNAFQDYEVFKATVALLSGKLYIFDINTRKNLFSSKKATSVCFGADMIAFSNEFGIVQFLNLDCKPLMKFQYGDDVCIKQIKIFQDRLLCVTVKKSLLGASVWSIKEKIKLYEIENVCLDLRLRECINEKNFIFCERDINRGHCQILVWNFLEGNRLFGFDTFMEPNTLISNNWYVIAYISFSEYYSAKMWSIKTGQLVDAFDVDIEAGKAVTLAERNMLYISPDRQNIIIRNYTPFFEL